MVTYIYTVEPTLYGFSGMAGYESIGFYYKERVVRAKCIVTTKSGQMSNIGRMSGIIAMKVSRFVNLYSLLLSQQVTFKNAKVSFFKNSKIFKLQLYKKVMSFLINIAIRHWAL